ncbi:MAG: hypothetical protein H0T42_22265 [Deltaproteobacteria bacterium]|nr:hypothetical protein [Deltaproteobacteria bacterium]
MRRTAVWLALLGLTGCSVDGAGAGGSGSDAGGGSGEPTCTGTDVDDDGWIDEVEVAVGTSPSDAADTPPARGLEVFVMPHHEMPTPASRDIVQAARLTRADVGILLDTTGSMLGYTSRIQMHLHTIMTSISAEVDDVAFGAAGYGDFPPPTGLDSSNSWADVPFYVVHRMMTARTTAGLASLRSSLYFTGILTGGLGPWFAVMRGGDEPEQGWEALRQAATGVGVTFPVQGGTRSVPPFSPTTVLPPTIPAGEEVGTLGGYGFRPDSVPVIVMITDTSNHQDTVIPTTPPIATRAVALQALHDRGARVIGLTAWSPAGRADLADVALQTNARVPPTIWGTGAARPANCPLGSCCVSPNDPDYPGSVAVQPLPDSDGLCTLVFAGDKYNANLATIIAQAVRALAQGGMFELSAAVRDDATDAIDVNDAFVERVEAVADGACAGSAVVDLDGDGFADQFPAGISGAPACFRLVAKANQSVPPTDTAQVFAATLQINGDGLAAFASKQVLFVVPTSSCGGPIFL